MKNTASRVLAAAVVAGTVLVSHSALAAAGDWILRGGATLVAPNDDSGTVVVGGLGDTGSKVSVGNDVKPSFTVTYMVTDAIGVELLGAFPFEHEVDASGGALAGLGHIADVQHLPPTLSLQYHFQAGAFRPYVGAGLNYTFFFEEEASSSLKAAGFNKASLKESFGYSLQLGADYELGNNWLVNADLRYIDIETEARLSGPGGATGKVDNIELNPIVFTLAVGKRF
ncbi:MAG TPA: OmpW family outer membrane protein [Gammaproteobacteria bacterium]|nr:OmpW family outer membrane protein [Gammaproteobacteria bacterium]